MKTSSSQRMRPAGRHLLTIGEDLIKDRTAAIVELVKNAYDADSPDVLVSLRVDHDSKLVLCVEDRGHGMTKDDVINKWLVPSTTSKVVKRRSPNGRILQGKKGIGRYASGILGDTLLLETVDEKGDETSLSMNWDDFRNAEFLDEVLIDVEVERSGKSSGTRITVEGGEEEGKYWSERRVDELIVELRMLVPPELPDIESDKFSIRIHYENKSLAKSAVVDEQIEPFPILDAYDYRVYGEVTASGGGELWFVNQKAGAAAMQIAGEGIIGAGAALGPTGCGNVRFDIRAFDREAKSLDVIRKRNLGFQDGLELSRRDVRSMLDRLNGIGVYRAGFRIRPLGDPANDWLKLNARRVQNPSMRIGVNQVVGYVHIEDESCSGLKEKSARDGLKDNEAFEAFQNLVLKVLQLLEERRFRFRRSQKERSGSVNDSLDNLQDYSELKELVSKELKTQGVNERSVEYINRLITKEEKRKKKYVRQVKQVVDAYRGQATLGKIIEIILHEGRRPLNYFKNQVPNLNYLLDKMTKRDGGEGYGSKVMAISRGIEENAGVLARLFSRIEPLTTRKRPPAYEVHLNQAIHNAFRVYEKQLRDASISFKISIDETLTIVGWNEDIYSIFVNLIDNSIYWIAESASRGGEISVWSVAGTTRMIVYQDSGPGIDPDVLRESIIFEPGYSGRGGTGLGLAIAGDSARRCGLTLNAIESKVGACFQIEF